MTLLEMTQNILNSLDGEEVDSIGNTVESLQIAEEIRNTYYEYFNNIQSPFRERLIKFDAVQDPVAHPNVLRVQDSVDEFYWIKYNVQTVDKPKYKELRYCNPKDFIEYLVQHVNSKSMENLALVEDIDTGASYYIKTNQEPEFWTTFDNKHIVVDSYNSSLDDTLQQSKLLAWASVIEKFKLEDSYTPPLEDHLFPMLLAEAKSAVWINYKGIPNSKEEQRSRRQKVTNQNNRLRHRDHQPNEVNFGRS